MKKVIFRNVYNVDRLFELFDSCLGSVYLQWETGEMIDIRNSIEVKKLLRQACKGRGIEALKVEITNKKDSQKILNYLLSCYRMQ